MPSLITHDRFGREVLASQATPFVVSTDERDAFLLGNQGPDPLFYCVASPSLFSYNSIGSLMHDKGPSLLMQAISNTISQAPEHARSVTRAYVAGFLCHYLLDRAAHPLVYAQQFALCNAGIEGLNERDGSEVHALIEAELDEMMLYIHTERTIADFVPHKELLHVSDQTLAAISLTFVSALWETYEHVVPASLFRKSVHNFRHIQHAFYSAHGTKRAALGAIERTFRRHSFTQAMSHRNIALTESVFDNHEHRVWENPFTNAVSTESFFDLFARALEEAAIWIPRITADDFSLEEARQLTRGLNFSGKPVEAERG